MDELKIVVTDSDGTKLEPVDVLGMTVKERLDCEKFAGLSRSDLLEHIGEGGDNPEVERWLYFWARKKSGNPVPGRYDEIDFVTSAEPREGAVSFDIAESTKAQFDELDDDEEGAEEVPTQPAADDSGNP